MSNSTGEISMKNTVEVEGNKESDKRVTADGHIKDGKLINNNNDDCHSGRGYVGNGNSGVTQRKAGVQSDLVSDGDGASSKQLGPQKGQCQAGERRRDSDEESNCMDRSVKRELDVTEEDEEQEGMGRIVQPSPYHTLRRDTTSAQYQNSRNDITDRRRTGDDETSAMMNDRDNSRVENSTGPVVNSGGGHPVWPGFERDNAVRRIEECAAAAAGGGNSASMAQQLVYRQLVENQIMMAQHQQQQQRHQQYPHQYRGMAERHDYQPDSVARNPAAGIHPFSLFSQGGGGDEREARESRPEAGGQSMGPRNERPGQPSSSVSSGEDAAGVYPRGRMDSAMDGERDGEDEGQSPLEGELDIGGQVASAGQLTFEEQFKKLYEMSDDPDRKKFLDGLFEFMHKRGTPINRIPIMAKGELDLYMLYRLVVSKGGLVQVINKKLWREVTKGLNLPSSITSAAFTLRTQYTKHLYPYEVEQYGFSNQNDLNQAIDSNRREARQKPFGSSTHLDPSDPNALYVAHMNNHMSNHLNNPMANHRMNNHMSNHLTNPLFYHLGQPGPHQLGLGSGPSVGGGLGGGYGVRRLGVPPIGMEGMGAGLSRPGFGQSRKRAFPSTSPSTEDENNALSPPSAKQPSLGNAEPFPTLSHASQLLGQAAYQQTVQNAINQSSPKTIPTNASGVTEQRATRPLDDSNSRRRSAPSPTGYPTSDRRESMSTPVSPTAGGFGNAANTRVSFSRTPPSSSRAHGMTRRQSGETQSMNENLIVGGMDEDEGSSVSPKMVAPAGGENEAERKPRPSTRPVVPTMPSAHLKITSQNDGRSEFNNSLVVSMEVNGTMFQGVLFAQPPKQD